MAEERQCQTQEGHCLCPNNCGFLGSSATMNLRSNCYRSNLCLKQQTFMKSTVKSFLSSVSPPSPEIEIGRVDWVQVPIRNDLLRAHRYPEDNRFTFHCKVSKMVRMMFMEYRGLCGFKELRRLLMLWSTSSSNESEEINCRRNDRSGDRYGGSVQEPLL
ncbi:unnamed protein product [Brassica oleracea]|uniref:A20-type domain-containing protein n=1 Tax=Brassica oleracea var. oleracea TaxID=109376 RepID=A0A0D3CUF7_BRAOL